MYPGSCDVMFTLHPGSSTNYTLLSTNCELHLINLDIIMSKMVGNIVHCNLSVTIKTIS